MDVLYRRCAGFDVHQAQVTACIRVTPESGLPQAWVREFETTPAGLAALRDWLVGHDVWYAAMEGTGVYWLPVFTVLEAAGIDLTLCNAHHVKNVPGRKTDKSDAAWLAQLMASGLLRKSFVPPAAVRQLRELTRARVHRVEDRSRVVNTMHRLLERAGLKLCSVVSDLQGQSSQAILTALVAGETDAKLLAGLAVGNLKAKRAQLEAVLGVKLSAVERTLLSQSLAQLDLYNQQIVALDKEVSSLVTPWRAAFDRLRAIHGIDEVTAAAILAEVGPDVSAFDDPHRLASWAGLAPGQRESAGKHKKTGTRDGNAYLRRILVQVAISLSRSKKHHDLADFFRKKMPVLGFKKAAVATAHKLLVRIWAMLRRGEEYTPPQPKPLSERQRSRRARRALSALQELGFDVVIAGAAVRLGSQ